MTAPCVFCGEPELLEVLELWIEDRSFMVETCCESSNHAAVEWMRDWSRSDWSQFLQRSAGVEVRSVGSSPENGPSLVLDYGLELAGSTTAKDKRARERAGEAVKEVTRDEARAFVLENHRHSPSPPAGWRWGHAVWNGPELVAVAMVGRPAARLTDASSVAEVTRICVRDGIKPCIAWNACSMLYGAAAREAKRRGFNRIQTFTIAGEESGTSLKAAGWTVDKISPGGSWSRPSRSRKSRNSTAPKARWARSLNSKPRQKVAQ
jgi:hypothetical protein